MTTSQTSTEVGTREQSPSVRPTRNEIITAIIADAKKHDMTVTPMVALYIVDMFGRAASKIRKERVTCEKNGSISYYEPMFYLDDMDLKTTHRILDAIMPDDTVPAQDSAPDLLGRHFLESKELNFVHTKGDQGVREGHCSVAVAIDRTDAA